MKKILTLALLLAMLATTLCSCIGDETEGANLGDYNVDIESIRVDADDEGTPIAIVKYKFTNHSDSAECFYMAVDTYAYQNGIELLRCFTAEAAGYSEEDHERNVKPGYSIEVEVAYELDDPSADVEIEVVKSFSIRNRKITKTFTLQ